MRIAFFTYSYIPDYGGLPISIESYRKALEKLGEEVYIFAPKYPPWFPPFDDSGKKVWRFPSLYCKLITPYPYPIIRTKSIENFFSQIKFDIIHSHNPFIFKKITLHLSKKFCLPLVFTNHALYHIFATYYIPLIPKKVISNLAIKKSTNYANKTDLVITPSEEVKEMLLNFGVRTRIEVIPTGLDLSLWEKRDPQKFLSDKPWKDKKILLYAGRLAKEKNVEFLLISLAPLLNKRDDTVLLIVGDGDQREYLENLKNKLFLNNKAFFLGWFPREKLIDFYTSSHIFVFPSITETQGLVILEALAGGCAVVAVNATGSKSLVSDGIDGFLTPLDPNAFSQKVELLLDNPQLLNKMRSNAKIKAQSFSIDPLAKKLIDLYREIAKNREK